jgi:glycosyltransferase involved in cell wall biosynthesis
MTGRILIAHPSPDLYGSDRQLLESLTALVSCGWTVLVAVPREGPLCALLRERGAEVVICDVPVLRKSLLRPERLAGLIVFAPVVVYRLWKRVRTWQPDMVYVNTVTIPLWALAARLAGKPVLTHVHEAEQDQPRMVRTAIVAPLFLARVVVVNSYAAGTALTDVFKRLRRRIRVVYNGLPDPGQRPRRQYRAPDGPAKIVLVGRLSPRKGTDVAVDALAVLRALGREVSLTVCGTVFPGYEWYEGKLHEQVESKNLVDVVTFTGYKHPTLPYLIESDIVLVPSRVEPFGNTAVEGMLAERPVVASDVQGLAEVIQAGRTGILVPPDDAVALAEAIASLLDDPERAASLAAAARQDALQRFSLARYGSDICAAVAATVDRSSPSAKVRQLAVPASEGANREDIIGDHQSGVHDHEDGRPGN